METRTKALLALLLLPGPIAEIISSNTPVYKLLALGAWVALILIYGCGTLLIREAKVRWGLQWSVVLLAIAYGIFEEGLVTQAFFNPHWFTAGNYWMAFGVQWGWTILLLVFHASISTLIPIYMINRLWTDSENKQLLGNRGIAIVIAGTLAGIGLGMNVFAGPSGPGGFFAAPGLLIAGSAAIGVLALLAYKLRHTRIVLGRGLLPPAAIAAVAFIFQGLNTRVPPALSHFGFGVEAGVPVQLFFVLLFALFSATQLLNRKTEGRHVVGFVFGSVFFWIVICFLNVLFGAAARIDLVAVAPVAFVLLAAWRRRALRNGRVPKPTVA